MTIADYAILTIIAALFVALVYEWRRTDPIPPIDHCVHYVILGQHAFIQRLGQHGYLTVDVHPKYSAGWRGGDRIEMLYPDGSRVSYHLMAFTEGLSMNLADLAPVTSVVTSVVNK